MSWQLASRMHLWLNFGLDGQHGCRLLSAISDTKSCTGAAIQRHQRCWINGIQAVQSSSPLNRTSYVCQI